MEPVNVNPAPDPDDLRIEAMLRAPERPLPDHGFSARVLAALPAGQSVPTPQTHYSWAAVAATLGCVVTLLSSAPWPELRESLSPLVGVFSALSPDLADPALLAGLVVAIVSTGYALLPTLVRKRA